MANEIDDRDPPYDEFEVRRTRPRSQEDRRVAYGDSPPDPRYPDAQRPDLDRRSAYDEQAEYDEEPFDDGQAPYPDDEQRYRAPTATEYREDYPDYGDDQAPNYEAPAEKKKSRLVPLLSFVAVILVIAIGALVVLYALGILPGSEPTMTATEDQTPTVETETAAEPAPTEAARQIDLSSADGTATAQAPDVRDTSVTIAPPAQGEPPVRSSHGDWQIRCDTPAGAQGEQCVLMQFVTAEDRDNVGLSVIILKTADGQARLMRVLAPLGVLIPEGLGLKIDETNIGFTQYVRCLPNGCVAEVILDDQLLGQLGGGQTATFIIFQTPEEGIGIPISLAGFQPGFAALP